MQDTYDIEKGLMELATLFIMETTNAVSIIEDALHIWLGNGKDAYITIKKVTDSHELKKALKKHIEQLFQNHLVAIKLR